MTDKLQDDLTHALGDAYTIERELLGGGMSRVFVAREHALGREVVIKVLPPELAAGMNRERFRREVQLAARLSHPYIVPLLHAGESGELLWFTMPYIHGESLRARLERHGPLGVRDAIQMLRDTLEALAYAHGRGVIHRDIKPANILSDGQHAMVTDFGVAKALSAAMPMGVAGHTTSGMAIGTPAYMAPEQLAADPAADHRVDLYAVGLLAYELLVGASPFAAPSPTATMTAQLTRTPDLIHLSRPEVPPALSELVARLLAKEPDQRPADAKEVLTELDRISGVLAADAHRSHTGESAAAAAPAAAWPLVLATLGVIGLVAGGVWYTQRDTGQATPGRVDTLYMAAGKDLTPATALKTPAAKPLTHADSLRIAQALRAELEQVDPKYKAKRAEGGTVSTEESLERQLATTDSLVRLRLAEYSRRGISSGNGRGDVALAPMYGSSMTGTAPNARSTPGGGSTIVTGPSIPHRVVVLNSPPRNVTDPNILALGAAATKDLVKRLSGTGWQVITVEGPDAGARGAELSTAEALVTVSVAQTTASSDSFYLRIGVRNTTPGSAFGYRVVTSDAVLHPSSIAPFMRTVGEAMGLMRSLQELSPGQNWQLDMGRIRDFPRYPSDSMMKRYEGLRGLRPDSNFRRGPNATQKTPDPAPKPELP